MEECSSSSKTVPVLFFIWSMDASVIKCFHRHRMYFQKRLTTAAFTAGLWLCGSQTTTLAAIFDFSNFPNANGLTLVSDATIVGNSLRLSSSNYSRAGAAYLSNMVNIADGFTVTFSFQITDRHQLLDNGAILSGSDVASGGDGLTFIVQNYAQNALGLANSGIGYYGIPNSLAVEFDTWKNQKTTYCEPNNNHIAVQSLGTAANRPEHCASTDPADPFANPNLGIYTPNANMADGSIYQAKITYAPGSLKVFFVDLSNPVMDVALNLQTLLSLQEGTDAYIGFTSSTGGAWENHDLTSFSFANTPEPSTALLLGFGLMVMAGGFSRRK